MDFEVFSMKFTLRHLFPRQLAAVLALAAFSLIYPATTDAQSGDSGPSGPSTQTAMALATLRGAQTVPPSAPPSP